MECVTALQEMQPPVPVTLHVDAVGDRLIVTASGEFDLESGQVLQQTLSDALDHAVGGLELDLAGVEFCDCSALNVLLRVRHRALQASKSFILCATSPAVARLLALTSTLPLFTAGEEGTAEHLASSPHPTYAETGDPPDCASEEDVVAAIQHTPSPERLPRIAKSSGDDQAVENTQLRRAMQTRPTIDMARGILMASFQLTSQQSWQVLVTASQHSNIKVRLIADALMQTFNGQALPEPLADHLAAAVRAHGTPAQ
ncbi:anti-sigma factor antagonist [Streptomyces yatensis]|uniref:Anti-sigma factor antagonist n=1 Tax=Streptomyces yatensis TaxID=155177 RepID=A0ABN2JIS7_9ACTN|nr:anti-sigma factor antagonist [Streptomyces yatensis]